MKIEPIFKGDLAIICCTGPSITAEVVDKCNAVKVKKNVRLFGANLTYKIFHLDVLHACNYQFYDHYWNIDRQLRCGDFFKWTTRPQLESKYPGVNYIKEVWEDGLSTKPDTVHAHHGTSAQLVNLALHYGCRVMLLVGWDMRYPGKLDDRNYVAKRHYFGEYPTELQHWPRTGPQGELSGLIKEMETIHPGDYGIEIINCTPDSAMTCFPMMDLDEALDRYT